jgi:hypothetical protein
MKTWLLAIGLAASLSVPSRPRACSLTENPVHEIDVAMQATDRVSPVIGPMFPPSFGRGHAPLVDDGCSGADPQSCDAIGTIVIDASATDDVTPPERIGYRLVLTGGTLPPGITLPAAPIEPGPERTLRLSWNDGLGDEQEAFSFTISMVAIDLAGNQSPPQTVSINAPATHPPPPGNPDGDCAVSIGPRPIHLEIGAALLALLLVRVRTPRRTRSGAGPCKAPGSARNGR